MFKDFYEIFLSITYPIRLLYREEFFSELFDWLHVFFKFFFKFFIELVTNFQTLLRVLFEFFFRNFPLIALCFLILTLLFGDDVIFYFLKDCFILKLPREYTIFDDPCTIP